MATLINKIALPATLALGASFMPMKAAHASTGSDVATPVKSFCVYPDGVTPSQTLMTCVSPNGQMNSISLNDHGQRINQGFMQSYTNGLLQSASERLPQGVAAIKVTGNKAIVYLMPNTVHFGKAAKTAMAKEFLTDIQTSRANIKMDISDSAFQHQHLTFALSVIEPHMAAQNVVPTVSYKIMPSLKAHQGANGNQAVVAPVVKKPVIAAAKPVVAKPVVAQVVKAIAKKTVISAAKAVTSTQNVTAVSSVIVYDKMAALFAGIALVVGAGIGFAGGFFARQIAEARKAKAIKARMDNMTSAAKADVVHTMEKPKPVLMLTHEAAQTTSAAQVLESFRHASKVFANWNKPDANKEAATVAMNNALAGVETSLVAFAETKPQTSEAAEALCSVARYAARKNEMVRGVKFNANNKDVLLDIIAANAGKIEDEKLQAQMIKFVAARRPVAQTATKTLVLEAA